MYNLVGHSTMRTTYDFLYRTDIAVLLFKCLKVAGFFCEQPTDKGNLDLKVDIAMFFSKI